jgi:hypothetical protein
MSDEELRDVEVRSAVHLVPDFDGYICLPAVNLREAFRLRHLARNHRYLQGFYDEHSLFVEAREARSEVMRLLRTACDSWHLALRLVEQEVETPVGADEAGSAQTKK